MRAGMVRLTIDSRVDHVHMIGLAVRGICASIPLSEEDAYQVELCIVEAVNNSVEHAYHGESGHDVTVVASLGAGRLVLEVLDGGTPMDWPSVQERREQASLLDEGGRGFLIMETYMDEVSYDRVDGRNVLTLVKGIRADAHP
jgi:serine/threonine-protein kinase RsbW